MEEKVTLFTKRKNIQTVFEYALDLKIPFTVNPRGIAADEFEVDLTVNGIKQAVALGMFVKEHKFDVSGLGELAKTKTTGNSSSKKSEVTKDNGLGNLAEMVSNPEEQNGNSAVLNF